VPPIKFGNNDIFIGYMTTNYTLTEGNDALNKVLLMMRYDLGKTLSENVIQEQDTAFTRQLDKDYSTVKGAEKRLNAFTSEERHTIIQIAAFGSLFIPVVGPLISLGLDVADATLYASEGDNYQAGLTLAFSLIPGAQLVSKIPAVKQLGKKGLITLLKKAQIPKVSSKLTELEKTALEQITKNSKWIKLTAMVEASKKLLKSMFGKYTIVKILTVVIKFLSSIGVSLSKVGLQIGGVWMSYDYLAKKLGIIDGSKIDQKFVDKLNFEYKKNPDIINKQIEQSVGKNLTDEEKNKQWLIAFNQNK